MMTVADAEVVDAECRKRGYSTVAIVGMANVLPKLAIYRFRRRCKKGYEYQLFFPQGKRGGVIFDLKVI